MEIKSKKAVSVFRLFLGYIVGLSTAIIILIIAIIIVSSICLQSGIVLPANYADIKLTQLEESFLAHFDKSLLPPYCSYIVIDENSGIISGDMSKKDTEKTRIYLLNGTKAYSDAYKIIRKASNNIIVIKYDILAHFANPMLNSFIPYPELLILFALLVLIILFTVVTASKFSKKLKRNLIPIITATEKIEAQDLDFEIEASEILEFNASLEAICKLKKALTLSLNEQWDKEQQRKAQLSSLAHDIKTPLTIIRGNAELLAEYEYSCENKELLSYIKANSDTIEQYLELLINIVYDGALAFDKKPIALQAFTSEVADSALQLCKVKGMSLNFNNYSQCELICIDKALVKRAIINIVDNAVRYSPQNSSIDIVLQDTELHIVFVISDRGPGFLGESFRKATQEFFTQEASRTNKHYGLGLSFAKKIAEMHGGALLIENRSDNKGAKVSISFAK